MTVSELIEKLRSMPQDAIVLRSGWDAYYDAPSFSYISDEPAKRRIAFREGKYDGADPYPVHMESYGEKDEVRKDKAKLTRRTCVVL